MNVEIQKRRTAFKIAIGFIAKGTLRLEKDSDDPTKEHFNFLGFEGKEINRINIIANVIDKFQNDEKTFATLTIDDGTGNMRIRAFSDSMSLITEIDLGTTILIIGTLRYFNNELYILPEIIKQLDPRWLLARKFELEKEFGDVYKGLTSQPPPEPTPEPVPQPPPSPEPIPPTPPVQSQEQEVELVKIEKIQDDNEKPSIREEVFQLIKDSETEQGIDIDKVIMQLNHQPVEKIKDTIAELLEAGEIFEPQPGRLRIL